MTQRHFPLALALSALCAGAAAAAPRVSPLKADLERGYRMKEENRVPEAVSAFGAVLKKDPTNHAALSELGYLHAGLKQPAAAAKYLSAASLQEPGDMRLRMDLAYAYQGLKKTEQAAAQFKAVSAKAGEYQAPALKELGFIDLAAGRLQAAAADFEAHRALLPDDLFVALQLGYTYDRLQKKEQAREAFGAALASTDVKVHDAAQAALNSSAPAAASKL